MAGREGEDEGENIKATATAMPGEGAGIAWLIIFWAVGVFLFWGWEVSMTNLFGSLSVSGLIAQKGFGTQVIEFIVACL